MLAGPPAVRDVPWVGHRAGRLAGQQFGQGRGGQHLVGHAGRGELAEVAFHEAGVEAARQHVRVAEQGTQERGVGGDPEHGRGGQRSIQAAQRRVPVRGPGDDLGQHGVVGAGHRHAGRQAGVGPHVRAGRFAQREDGAAGGQEPAGRVFGVDPGLGRVAGQPDLLLPQREGLARGHAQLPLDQIEAGDQFGDGVLDLQPGVHLHEEELIRFVAGHDELHGARAHVPDAAGRLGGGAAHRVPAGFVQQRGGCFLDDLLVPALQAAFAFAEVDGVAVGVGEDLDLDVPGPFDEPLQQQRVVAERGLGFTAGPGDRPGQLAGRAGQPHTFAAAPGRRLDQQGEPDGGGGVQQIRFRHSPLAGPGDDRHAGHGDGGLGGNLVAHRLDGCGRGPDEDQARVRAGPGERGVLGQEPVTRVDGLGAGLACSVQDAPDVQVALGGRGRAEPDRLVGLADVPGTGVGVAVDRDAGDAEGPQGADDADGDLSAVGHQDRVEHGRPHIRKTP